MAYPNPTQPVVINVSTSITPQADTRLRTFCVVSCGDTSLDAGKSVIVNSTNYASNVTASSFTAKALKSFFAQAPKQTCVVIEVKGSGSPAVSQQVQTLIDYITAGLKVGYGYCIPPTITADASCEGLFSAYSSLTQGVYFFIDMEADVPTSSTLWTTYVNKAKSVFGVYPSIATADYVGSATAMGICASPSYNITSSNKLSDLNQKICGGIQSTELDTALEQDIADATASFFYNDGSTCLLGGGRMADGELWTSYYAWDLTISKVESAIRTCLLNSSNVPNTAIYFDNQGITTLAQVIINTLKTCKTLGLVANFGSGKDLTTDTITGLNKIFAVPVSQWKQENPTEFKQGIYGGFTAYIEVGSFIQQVIFNVNKG